MNCLICKSNKNVILSINMFEVVEDKIFKRNEDIREIELVLLNRCQKKMI